MGLHEAKAKPKRIERCLRASAFQKRLLSGGEWKLKNLASECHDPHAPVYFDGVYQ